jgi:threonine dehydrogenase-like Zn-dependent dehydrogenase
MRAAVIAKPFAAELRDKPIPQPGAVEIRVKLQGCGLCGSNIPVWEGRPWFDYPLPAGAPGHEGWGIVDAIGAGVDDFAIGDRVGLLSECAYAEYDVGPAAAALPLPQSLNSKPFPAEPLGCAMNVFRRSNIQSGERVAIIGIGFLGALLTRLASAAGARVFAISRSKFALEIAASFGAVRIEPLNDYARVRQAVLSWSDQRGCDCVIEVVGKQEPLDLAGELTRERGRLVIAGYHQDGKRHVNIQLWNWRGLDVINAHERQRDVYLQGMREAVDAVIAGVLDPSPLYTHVFPLEELSEAFNAATNRREGFLKALVTP